MWKYIKKNNLDLTKFFEILDIPKKSQVTKKEFL